MPAVLNSFCQLVKPDMHDRFKSIQREPLPPPLSARRIVSHCLHHLYLDCGDAARRIFHHDIKHAVSVGRRQREEHEKFRLSSSREGLRGGEQALDEAINGYNFDQATAKLEEITRKYGLNGGLQ